MGFIKTVVLLIVFGLFIRACVVPELVSKLDQILDMLREIRESLKEG